MQVALLAGICAYCLIAGAIASEGGYGGSRDAVKSMTDSEEFSMVMSKEDDIWTEYEMIKSKLTEMAEMGDETLVVRMREMAMRLSDTCPKYGVYDDPDWPYAGMPTPQQCDSLRQTSLSAEAICTDVGLSAASTGGLILQSVLDLVGIEANAIFSAPLITVARLAQDAISFVSGAEEVALPRMLKNEFDCAIGAVLDDFTVVCGTPILPNLLISADFGAINLGTKVYTTTPAPACVDTGSVGALRLMRHEMMHTVQWDKGLGMLANDFVTTALYVRETCLAGEYFCEFGEVEAYTCQNYQLCSADQQVTCERCVNSNGVENIVNPVLDCPASSTSFL